MKAACRLGPGYDQRNGWIIKIGRGFDIYQRPDDWFSIGVNDLSLRPCLETTVDILRTTPT